MATESSNEPAQLLVAQIRFILWQVARIVIVAVLGGRKRNEGKPK